MENSQERTDSAVETVRNAQRVIAAHLDENLTLQDIADRVYASRTYLCIAFKQQTGQSVGAYLRACRVERAKELLADTAAPISEIARTVGYQRQSSFSEAFRKETGASPSEWRAAHRTHTTHS